MTIRALALALFFTSPLWGSPWLQDAPPPSSPAQKTELHSARGKKIPAGARILSYKIW